MEEGKHRCVATTFAKESAPTNTFQLSAGIYSNGNAFPYFVIYPHIDFLTINLTCLVLASNIVGLTKSLLTKQIPI